MSKMRNRVDTVFVLMIFCVFAISVFLVLILSGSIYRNMADTAGEGQNERIALSYIRTRIRKTDGAGSISVGSFHDLSVLSLEETLGERVFVTYIYLYDGWIHELFHERGQDFLPRDGIALVRADSLSFEEVEEGLIRVSTDYKSLLIYPRSSRKVVALY